ncbi:MAG: hypothetical protein V3V99_10005 [candidate division Zixibacteria bacterium]
MEHDDDKTKSHITLTKGTMLGHYRIIEKIGAGAPHLQGLLKKS